MTDVDGRRIRTLLEDRMADEPLATPVDEVIDSCRVQHRRQRRRLVTVSAVGVALAAMVPVVLTQVGPFDRASDPPRVTAVDGLAALSDRQIVELCRQGNQGPKANELFFGSGTPAIRERGSVADMSRIVLMSADGRYWAQCFINHYAGAEFSAGIEGVHSTEDTSTGVPYTAGFTCKDLDGPPSPPCDTFMVMYVDRLQAPVAAVEFTTADGVSTTVGTDDGFVVFTYAGNVPAGYSKTELRRGEVFLSRITYLSEDGTPLAAQKFGSSNPEAMKVDDLPLLEAYPSQRTKGIGIDTSGRPPTQP